MKRIEWTDFPYSPQWDDFTLDLQTQFGEPQIWNGLVEEPVQLKSPYRWARGRHRGGGSGLPRSCVWVIDEIYTWYLLKWR